MWSLLALSIVAIAVASVAGPARPAVAEPGDVDWAKTFGQLKNSRAVDVVGDGFGGSYVVGDFADSMTVGGKTVTTHGGRDVFVYRFDDTGIATWATALGGSGGEEAGAIGIDAGGGVYVSGYFGDSMSIGPNPMVASGVTDGFVAKLDLITGAPQWGRKVGTAGFDAAPLLAPNPTGGVTIGGQMASLLVVGGTSVPAGPGGPLPDIWLARLAADGTVVWARKDGGAGSNDELMSLAADGAGGVIAYGLYDGDTSLAGRSYPASDERSAFVARYDGAGTGVWSNSVVSTSTVNTDEVAVDRNGTISITGNFSGSITSDTTTLTAVGPPDAFLLQFSPTGSLTLGRSYSATGSAQSGPIAFDEAGNLLVVMHFGGTFQLGPIGPYTAVGSSDDAVIALSPSGSPLWGTFVTSAENVELHALAVVTGDPVVVGSINADTTLQAANVPAVDLTGLVARYHDPIPDTASARYFPITPTRVLDSRNGTGGFGSPWGPGVTRNVKMASIPGVPTHANAVVVNVTITNPSAATHLTVFPAGVDRPPSSNLNAPPGRTVASLVSVAVPDSDLVSIYNNSGTTDVLADIVGYYSNVPDGAGFVGITPARLLDSRDGTGGYATKWGPGEQRPVTVAGIQGIPADATAVVLNLTAEGPTAATHLTVSPTGEPLPTASSLNVIGGETRPNLVVAKVGAGQKVTIFNNSGQTNVIADAVGYLSPSTGVGFSAVVPARVLDSRNGTGGYSTPWGPGTTRELEITGVGGAPVGAQAVVLTVTVTGPTQPSHLTVYPNGVAKPTASNLNYSAGQTISNEVIVKVGQNGRVKLFNNGGSTNVIVDVVGWYR